MTLRHVLDQDVVIFMRLNILSVFIKTELKFRDCVGQVVHKTSMLSTDTRVSELEIKDRGQRTALVNTIWDAPRIILLRNVVESTAICI